MNWEFFSIWLHFWVVLCEGETCSYWANRQI